MKKPADEISKGLLKSAQEIHKCFAKAGFVIKDPWGYKLSLCYFSGTI